MNKQIGIFIAVFFLSLNGLMNATTKEEQLLFAVKNDDIEQVQQLLDAKANPNIADNEGRTPLLVTAYDKEIIKALLVAGANPNIASKQGYTPTDQALSYPEIKKYIEEKIKITKPLLAGAKIGRIDVMKNALKAGALINMPDEKDNTALYCAIMSDNLDTVKYLLQFAKNINFSLKNNKGQTVIDLAIAWDNLSALDLIKQATELKK
jgi:ankyrin repeat protein